MSERSSDRPHDGPRADPTRDIRLPPLSDRPAAAVPPERSTDVPRAPVPSPPRGSVDEPTNRLASPSDPLRQHTRTYSSPPPVQLLKVTVTPRRRTTTKVLWTLVFLTLVVIVACGVYLVVLVTQR